MNKEERKLSSEFLMRKFKEKDITQQYLSQLSGVPYYSVNKYLHGRTFPNHDNVYKIGKILGFTCSDFFNYVIR